MKRTSGGAWIVVAALLAAAPAFAQYSKGPAFDPGMGGHEDQQKLRWKRCFDRHRAPSDRASSCRHLLEQGDKTVDEGIVAQAYIEAGQYDDALAILTPRLNAVPDDTGALMSLSILAAVQGQYDNALKSADLSVSAANGAAYAYSGRCWMRAVAGKDLDAALADCDKALAMAPRDSAIWDSRGLVDFKRGDMNAAIADYDKSISYRSYTGGVFDTVARLMGSDAALDEFQVQASTYYMRGMARRRAGDADGGDADIATAKNLDPYVDDEYARYGVKP